jgi:hypothetical protein
MPHGLRGSLTASVLALLGSLALLSVLALLLAAPPASASGDAAQELARQYAPIVVVPEQSTPCGPGEPYRPAPVDTVLGRTDVTLRGPSGEAITSPTAADLAGKGEGWYLDLPGNPLSPGCTFEQWYREVAAGQPATVYAHLATDPSHPGMVALQYWFFWIFNDWNDRHEGDWEMVQLLFPADSAEGALAVAPTAVAYAQHEGSEVADWDDPKLRKVDDHVVVYPAAGSHAAYFTQAEWFGKSAAAGFGCDDTRAPGVKVVPVVAMANDSDPWLEYTGRWGEKEPSFNNGPTGPNTKTQWSAPVTWQVDEGRTSAVALPVVGGPAVQSFCQLTQAGSLLFIALLDQPVLVGLAILAILIAAALLIRATRWRSGGDRSPDRERRAGQIVSSSFGLLIHNGRALWPVMLLTGLTQAGMLAIDRLVLRPHPTESITDVNGLVDRPAAYVAAVLIPLALTPLIAIAMAGTSQVVEELAHGHRPSGLRALALEFRRPTAALVQLALLLLTTMLASSLYLLPVALVVIALWAVAMPAAQIERLGFVGAFRRSRQLTRGRRWRAVLLSALLVWIGFALPDAVGGILLLLTGWPFWVSNLVAIGVAAVLVPFSAIGLTMQFYDFRQEVERDQNSRASASSTPRSAS